MLRLLTMVRRGYGRDANQIESEQAFQYAQQCRGICLVAHSTRSLLILPEVRQHLTETLLAGSTSTALWSLSTNVNQLGDALPASATRDRILSVCQKLLRLFASLCDSLLLLGVVVLVEIIDVLLGFFDGLGLLGCELLSSLGIASIALLSPLLDDLGFLLLFGICGVA
jgi:hypothetical protein